MDTLPQSPPRHPVWVSAMAGSLLLGFPSFTLDPAEDIPCLRSSFRMPYDRIAWRKGVRTPSLRAAYV